MEALPSKQEIEVLVADLKQLAEGYTPAADLDGYLSRARIVAKAKEVARALVAPEQIPNYHGLNVCFLLLSPSLLSSLFPYSFLSLAILLLMFWGV